MSGGDAERRRAAVRAVLGDRAGAAPRNDRVEAYAPANVALIKYWGKRDEALNLPDTDSLSLALGDIGTRMAMEPAERDRLSINGERIEPLAPMARRFSEFLDLFRSAACPGFAVDSVNIVPTAAGVASSASAFAAAVRCLDRLFGWALPDGDLSVLARLGSGSACRSLWPGFVRWSRGASNDGSDSRGLPLAVRWPSLRVGLWILHGGPKPIGSRAAMQHCRQTSPLYAAWPATVAGDLDAALAAASARDLARLGPVAEGNALAMHAVMLAARPAVRYLTDDTFAALDRVAAWRADGLAVWATIDAGPNLKLLFETADESALMARAPELRIIDPWRLPSV